MLGFRDLPKRIFGFVRNLREKAAPLANPISVIAFFVSVSMIAHWFVCIPTPGKAIGLLGAVAVIMALRGEIHGSEKVAWILIVFALFYVEIRAIDKDRYQHDKEQIAIRNDETSAFQSIADGIRTSINNNQKAFDATMGRMGELATLSNEGIKTITGGDSFCYMDIMDSGDPVFQHVGKYPLYDLEARIADLAAYQTDKGHSPFSDLILRPGDLPIGKVLIYHGISIPLGDSNKRDFNIFMSAKNGSWSEALRMRRVNKSWQRAIKVRFEVRSQNNGKITFSQVFEQVAKFFPRKELDVGWNKKD